MKNAKTYVVLLLLAGVIGSAGLVSAFGMGFASEDQRAAIRQAIENNDFASWKSAVTDTLTQENFDNRVAMYARMSERKESISERAGLNNAVTQAIKDGNYGAYTEAAVNLANSNEPMTEEEFNAMAERYADGFGERFDRMGQFGHKGKIRGGHCMR